MTTNVEKNSEIPRHLVSEIQAVRSTAGETGARHGGGSTGRGQNTSGRLTATGHSGGRFVSRYVYLEVFQVSREAGTTRDFSFSWEGSPGAHYTVARADLLTGGVKLKYLRFYVKSFWACGVTTELSFPDRFRRF